MFLFMGITLSTDCQLHRSFALLLNHRFKVKTTETSGVKSPYKTRQAPN